MTREEIEALTPAERVAGYLVAEANAAYVGARRANGKATQEELDAACDEAIHWYDALTQSEWEDHLLPLQGFFGAIRKGTYPPPRVRQIENLKTGKTLYVPVQ